MWEVPEKKITQVKAPVISKPPKEADGWGQFESKKSEAGWDLEVPKIVTKSN